MLVPQRLCATHAGKSLLLQPARLHTGTSAACTEKARKEGKGLPICRAQLLDPAPQWCRMFCAGQQHQHQKAWLGSRAPPNPASHVAQQGERDSPHPARPACRAELLPKMPCASLVPIPLPGIQPPCSWSSGVGRAA